MVAAAATVVPEAAPVPVPRTVKVVPVGIELIVKVPLYAAMLAPLTVTVCPTVRTAELGIVYVMTVPVPLVVAAAEVPDAVAVTLV